MKAVDVEYAEAYPRAHYRVTDFTDIDIEQLLRRIIHGNK